MELCELFFVSISILFLGGHFVREILLVIPLFTTCSRAALRSVGRFKEWERGELKNDKELTQIQIVKGAHKSSGV